MSRRSPHTNTNTNTNTNTKNNAYRYIDRYTISPLSFDVPADISAILSRKGRSRVHVGLSLDKDIYSIFKATCGLKGRHVNEILEESMLSLIDLEEVEGVLKTAVVRREGQRVIIEFPQQITINKQNIVIHKPQRSQINIAGLQPPAEAERDEKTYQAKYTTVEKNVFGEVEEVEKTTEVSEDQLVDLLRYWPPVTEKGKQFWLGILRQIDHPIAKEILEKEEAGK